jgi:hypothetical protein
MKSVNHRLYDLPVTYDYSFVTDHGYIHFTEQYGNLYMFHGREGNTTRQQIDSIQRYENLIEMCRMKFSVTHTVDK